MEPLLRNGDVVAIRRRQPDAESGQIVVATLANGEFVANAYRRRKVFVDVTERLMQQVGGMGA